MPEDTSCSRYGNARPFLSSRGGSQVHRLRHVLASDPAGRPCCRRSARRRRSATTVFRFGASLLRSARNPRMSNQLWLATQCSMSRWRRNPSSNSFVLTVDQAEKLHADLLERETFTDETRQQERRRRDHEGDWRGRPHQQRAHLVETCRDRARDRRTRASAAAARASSGSRWRRRSVTAWAARSPSPGELGGSRCRRSSVRSDGSASVPAFMCVTSRRAALVARPVRGRLIAPALIHPVRRQRVGHRFRPVRRRTGTAAASRCRASACPRSSRR